MFIDTNILVNARFPSAAEHHVAREALTQAALSHERITISRQVLREYVAAITRQPDWQSIISRSEIVDDIWSMLDAFEVLENGPEVTRIFTDLLLEVDLAGRQVHDINIVATMLAHGEQRLLSLNARHFRHFERHIQLVTA